MSCHSPPTRQSHISYAMKPVLSPQLSIRSSQTKAMEKIDTAAGFLLVTDQQKITGSLSDYSVLQRIHVL